MFLAEPAAVTEIAITIRHGISDITSPHRMEVYAGPFLDRTTLALQTSIPRCEDGTRLVYRLAAMETECTLTSISSEPQPLPPFNSRVVHLTFHGVPYMMLGQLEVIGAIAPPPVVSQEAPKEASSTLGSDEAKRRYEEAIAKRTAPPSNISEALELEVMRLHAALLPAQRDMVIQRTATAGPVEGYNLTRHLSQLSQDSRDSAKKHKDGWGWAKMLRGTNTTEAESQGTSAAEADRQRALCQEAMALLKTHGQVGVLMSDGLTHMCS